MNKGKYTDDITAYTAELIGMITENYKLKTECIKKKKSISYCRRRINRELAIDTGRMQDEIIKEMRHYYSSLNMMQKFMESFDASDIESTEGMMDEILSAEPYTFRELVNDEEKRSVFKEQLQAEHEDYEQYLEILTDRMKSVINFPQ